MFHILYYKLSGFLFLPGLTRLIISVMSQSEIFNHSLNTSAKMYKVASRVPTLLMCLLFLVCVRELVLLSKPSWLAKCVEAPFLLYQNFRVFKHNRDGKLFANVYI